MSGPRTTTPGLRDPRYRALIQRLRAQRQSLKLSQRQLAERLGTHRQFICRVELGERRLDAVELVDFAAALELVAADLLQTVPPKERSDG